MAFQCPRSIAPGYGRKKEVRMVIKWWKGLIKAKLICVFECRHVLYCCCNFLVGFVSRNKAAYKYSLLGTRTTSLEVCFFFFFWFHLAQVTWMLARSHSLKRFPLLPLRYQQQSKVTHPFLLSGHIFYGVSGTRQQAAVYVGWTKTVIRERDSNLEEITGAIGVTSEYQWERNTLLPQGEAFLSA